MDEASKPPPPLKQITMIITNLKRNQIVRLSFDFERIHRHIDEERMKRGRLRCGWRSEEYLLLSGKQVRYIGFWNNNPDTGIIACYSPITDNTIYTYSECIDDNQLVEDL